MNNSIAHLILDLDEKNLCSVCCVANATQESKDLLDHEFPLMHGSHQDAASYAMYYQNLVVHMDDGTATGLAHPAELVEVFGRKAEPDAIVLENGHLHAEIELDRCGATRSIALEEH